MTFLTSWNWWCFLKNNTISIDFEEFSERENEKNFCDAILIEFNKIQKNLGGLIHPTPEIISKLIILFKIRQFSFQNRTLVVRRIGLFLGYESPIWDYLVSRGWRALIVLPFQFRLSNSSHSYCFNSISKWKYCMQKYHITGK